MERRKLVAWWIARHLPRWLRYWVVMDAGINHCGGPNHPDEIVPEVPFVTVMNRV
jgi:hypothetical protein